MACCVCDCRWERRALASGGRRMLLTAMGERSLAADREWPQSTSPHGRVFPGVTSVSLSSSSSVMDAGTAGTRDPLNLHNREPLGRAQFGAFAHSIAPIIDCERPTERVEFLCSQLPTDCNRDGTKQAERKQSQRAGDSRRDKWPLTNCGRQIGIESEWEKKIPSHSVD